MKHVITFIVLLFSLSQVSGQIENDKILHFGAGAVSGALGAFVASELSDGNRGWTFAGAVGGSLIAGLAKEAVDQKNSNNWDNADLAATVLGGVSVGVTIDLFSGKKRRKRKNAITHVGPSTLVYTLPETFEKSVLIISRMPSK
ncbi:MAG: hypothetical protein WBM53_18320 [Maribacter sp.]